MKNRIILLLIAQIFSFTLYAAEADWQSWSPQILQNAQHQNKLVLLDLTADWCPYCQKMKRTTWRDEQVIESMQQHYIAVRVNEAEYPGLVKRYPHVGRPGLVLLDAHGKEIFNRTGYIQPQHMLWTLQGAAAEFLTTSTASHVTP